MNARNTALNQATGLSRFVLCSENGEQAAWLGSALGKWGALWQEHGDPALLLARVIERNPLLALLDFSGHAALQGAAAGSAGAIARAIELAQALKQALPTLPLVAIGSMSYPDGALAAWRAGVSDFIDISASADDAREVVQRVLRQAEAHTPAAVRRGQLLTLLGVRPGVGTSTLAAHLADLYQRRVQAGHAANPGAAESRVALLDLGLPAGDGKLYLSTSGNFDFADAVRNLHRFDETLVHTALARSPGGVTVISLPSSLGEMRTVSQRDALALLDRLRLYFDVLIADLGGFSNQEFVANLAGAADQVWLVTDQSVGALVSLAGSLRELDELQLDARKRRLVVNRFNERYGMDAAQIAERFNLPLLAILPKRATALLSSANRGKLLHEVAPHDAYVRAVEGLLDDLTEPIAAGGQRQGMGRWIPKMLLRK